LEVNGHITPAFPLNQIKTPIAIFIGLKDTLPDLKYTLENCKKPLLVKTVEDYEHLDFIWASDLDEVVIPDVLDLLKKNGKRA
jgi:lysosomal acid lipase/cholesteryl ester hydrolase